MNELIRHARSRTLGPSAEASTLEKHSKKFCLATRGASSSPVDRGSDVESEI